MISATSRQMRFRKAMVMVRRDLNIDTWTEHHWGIVINQCAWGAQILDTQCPWNDLSPQLWSHAEWFPWRSKQQKVEVQ